MNLHADPDRTRDENPPPTDGPERRIGPYRLVRTIGHGGMGTVYLGIRDDAFQKRVAVKVLKRGMDTESIVRRFRHERQILASLEHPYIAGLLDGGTTRDGLPYFAMEYVEGRPIVDYCELHKLDTSARLELFRKVCAAVQYAHQNLIIHRDLKPGNVLVTADGTPKLLDFGIAKLLNPELGGHMAPTVPGLELMTPEYASPEQVRGDPVTTATDVYSLGVLLYELLTGRRPYRLTSRSPSEIARIVCESVPDRPSTAVTTAEELTGFDHVPTGADPESTPTRSTARRPVSVETDRLRRRLSGDLDNIVLKALSKEPGRRYASVDQFSEDIGRHLAGLPVIARKDTLGYRTAKFVRRNRAAVIAGALTLAALIAGIIGTTWQARVARAERLRAEQRFDDVRRLANSFLFELHDAIRDLPGSTPARQLLVSSALQYLDKLARDAGDRTDLRRDLAAAYLKVGDVQGRPFNPNLGDTAGALSSYRKSVELYESLGLAAIAKTDGAAATFASAADASTDDVRKARRELATAYTRMSEMLTSAGDTAAALSYAQKGLVLQKAVSGPTPASMEEGRELAASHSRVGDLLSRTGDTSAALQQRRTAFALMEAPAAKAPNDPANLRQLGVAHQKLGTTLGNPNAPNVGDFAGALHHLRESARVFRMAVQAHPANTIFRRNLAVAESNVADVLLALERPREALEAVRKSQDEFKALITADPMNATARFDAAIGYSKLGEMLDANGRTAEALAEFERALTIHQSLSAADPASVRLKAEIASDSNRVATVQVKLGMRGPGLANHTRAVEVSREVTASNPGDVELQYAIAMALTGRGDAYAAFARRRPSPPTQLEDLRAAVRDYREAVALFASLRDKGAMEGTDIKLLEKARGELQQLEAELAKVEK